MSGTCDVDGGLKGAVGTRPSSCDIKHELMMPEPGAVRKKISRTRYYLHLGTVIVIVISLLEGEYASEGVSHSASLESLNRNSLRIVLWVWFSIPTWMHANV